MINLISKFIKQNRPILKLIISVSFVFGLLFIIVLYSFANNNLILGLATFVLPLAIIYIYSIFAKPHIGYISMLFANYFAIGLSRYIPAPVGLTVDALLIFTWLVLIFSQFNTKLNWKNANNDFTWFVVAWFVMNLFQLINPEAVSKAAWFYAMRSVALYSFLVVPLTYLMFNRPKDLEIFIQLCAWFTVLAVAKALMQKYIGVDRWEQQWLNVPGNRTTHILFGKLRIFSFFSDAGTFGSSMGYFGVLFLIIGFHEKFTLKKYFYLFVGIASLYAMMISGTRSAIAVPLMGFSMYTILSKRVKVMFAVGTLLFISFFFLKYTTIGQGNYDIRRMRSAFSEDNESLNVRVENRKLFANYLKSRPFGGGVGSAGNWGLRFSPDTFLAKTATDGWYVQIWAEQGIVGLTFYLIMILYFAFKSSFIIFFKLKKPEYISKAIGLTCGMYGLLVSSYTASSLGQMPNTIIVFVSLVLISEMPKWEKEEKDLLEIEK